MADNTTFELTKKALAKSFREAGFTGRWARFRLRLDDPYYALVLLKKDYTLTTSPSRPVFMIDSGVFTPEEEKELGKNIRVRTIRHYARGMPWGHTFEYAADLDDSAERERFAKLTVETVMEQGRELWPHLHKWEAETFELPPFQRHWELRHRCDRFDLPLLKRAWADGSARRPDEKSVSYLEELWDRQEFLLSIEEPLRALTLRLRQEFDSKFDIFDIGAVVDAFVAHFRTQSVPISELPTLVERRAHGILSKAPSSYRGELSYRSVENLEELVDRHASNLGR